MEYFFISLIILIIALLVGNDAVFNRKRDRGLKILEMLVTIGLVGYLIYSMPTNIEKHKLASTVKKETQILGEEVSIVNLDGSVTKTTIGKYLHDNFVKDIFDGNTNISKEEYNTNNALIIIVSVVLLVYWITLLFLFEKETIIDYKPMGDEEIFKKYNPLIAACIAQNRDVMLRDILAVILNLVNKKKLNINIESQGENEKINYKYYISENKESTYQMDMTELVIYRWIFEEKANFENGVIKHNYIRRGENGEFEIDIVKRMKDLADSSESYEKIKSISAGTKEKLNSMGANYNAVPIWLRLVNNVLLVISIILIINHIMKNGLNIKITTQEAIYAMFIGIFVVVIIPIIYVLSIAIIGVLRNLFKALSEVTEGLTGRKLIAKAISIIFATMLMMIIYASFGKELYIMYDLLLLGVTLLILSTDDHMIKHDYAILNDYYNIKELENKIKKYSLMKDENIEYIELWEDYYTYAVAFGTPIPVKRQLDVIRSSDTQILTDEVIENIYYVCKNYLEVMWDMDFSNKKSESTDLIGKVIDKIFDTDL